MTVSPVAAGGASWSMEDIPYHALASDRIRDDQRLFHILASASFIEITSDLYTKNLVEFFTATMRSSVGWKTAGRGKNCSTARR